VAPEEAREDVADILQKWQQAGLVEE